MEYLSVLNSRVNCERRFQDLREFSVYTKRDYCSTTPVYYLSQKWFSRGLSNVVLRELSLTWYCGSKLEDTSRPVVDFPGHFYFSSHLILLQDVVLIVFNSVFVKEKKGHLSPDLINKFSDRKRSVDWFNLKSLQRTTPSWRKTSRFKFFFWDRVYHEGRTGWSDQLSRAYGKFLLPEERTRFL